MLFVNNFFFVENALYLAGIIEKIILTRVLKIVLIYQNGV